MQIDGKGNKALDSNQNYRSTFCFEDHLKSTDNTSFLSYPN